VIVGLLIGVLLSVKGIGCFCVMMCVVSVVCRCCVVIDGVL